MGQLNREIVCVGFPHSRAQERLLWGLQISKTQRSLEGTSDIAIVGADGADRPATPVENKP